MSQKSILAVGVDSAIFKILTDIDSNIKVAEINNLEEFEGLITQDSPPDVLFVICGNLANFVSPSELAQAMRGLYSDKKILYVMNQMEGYERKNLVKNGFDDVFMLPTDSKPFFEMIQPIISPEAALNDLRAVRLVDIDPNAILDFNIFIYFPKNKKYIKYAAAGYKVEPTRLTRLKDKDLGVIFVPKKEMGSFYKDSGKKLRNLVDVKNMSKTEAYEKIQVFVRDTFSTIFDSSIESDFETSKQKINDCKNVISYFLSGNDEPASWYEKIVNAIGTDHLDIYSHAMNVSVFASLFALGLGYKNIEDFAIAGLFHDLGLAGAPGDLEEKALTGLTPEEKAIYEKHPQKSVDMLKQKRMIITPLVEKMILDHHENYDGSGFPNKHAGHRVSDEAQIIQLASHFDVLTRYSRGSNRKSPEQFLDIIKTDLRFNAELVNKLNPILNP